MIANMNTDMNTQDITTYSTLFGGIFSGLIESQKMCDDDIVTLIQSSDFFRHAMQALNKLVICEFRHARSIPDDIRNWINSPFLDHLVKHRLQKAIIIGNHIPQLEWIMRNRAHIFRDSIKRLFILAHKYKREEMVKYIYHTFGDLVEENSLSFNHACRSGNLSLVQWLCRNRAIYDDVEISQQWDILICILESGNIELVNWVRTNFYDAISEVVFIQEYITNDYYNTHLNLYKYYYERFPNLFTREDIFQHFHQACYEGKIAHAKWFYKTFPEIRYYTCKDSFVKKVYKEVCKSKRYNMMMWMIKASKNKTVSLTTAILVALLKEDINFATFLYDKLPDKVTNDITPLNSSSLTDVIFTKSISAKYIATNLAFKNSKGNSVLASLLSLYTVTGFVYYGFAKAICYCFTR